MAQVIQLMVLKRLRLLELCVSLALSIPQMKRMGQFNEPLPKTANVLPCCCKSRRSNISCCFSSNILQQVGNQLESKTAKPQNLISFAGLNLSLGAPLQVAEVVHSKNGQPGVRYSIVIGEAEKNLSDE